MPILSRAFRGLVAFIASITDNFNRTTSGSLGTATSGQTWSATRGTWSANGTQATSTDTASTYPLASIPFKQDVTVSGSVVEGTGVAFWVTDANNWYATVAYRTQSSYSCNCSTCFPSCPNCPACGCQTYNSCADASCGCNYTCSSGYYCSANNLCYDVGPCSGSVVTGATCSSYKVCQASGCGCAICNTCSTSNCGAGSSCNCQTCTTNNYYMRMLKSVAGTVSTVISDYAVASLPAAIKVVTSGSTITEYAYSNTTMTTSLGNTSTTPASPTIGTGVGIIKAPAAVSQGTTVDDFSAS